MTARHPALVRLESYLGSRYSPHTIRDTLGQAGAFIAQSKGVGREYLIGYMDGLVSRGLKPRSIITIMSRLRALYHANGWSWPLLPRDMHLGLPDAGPGGPALSPDEIRQLILGAKGGGRLDVVAMALSTTWGFRPAEMATILSSGLDGRAISVQTSKLGRRREHTIPVVLASALTFRGRERTTDGLHKAFERLMCAHVRDTRTGEGWHSVRRSLVTGLLEAGLREAALHKWMGWQYKGQDIVDRYYRPDPAKLDAEVYALHPFLPFWA